MSTELPNDIDSLAQALGDRKGVWWSAQSSRMAGPSAPKDLEATQSAESWVKNPNPTTQAKASLAAKGTDFQGSGGWSAQAAAFAKPDGTGSIATGGSPTQALVPKMVAGSVKISAAKSVGTSVPSVSAPTAGSPGTTVASGATSLAGQKGIAAPQLSAPKTPSVSASAPQTSTPSTSAPALSADDQAKIDKAHQPFIELGQQILTGKKLWT